LYNDDDDETPSRIALKDKMEERQFQIRYVLSNNEKPKDDMNDQILRELSKQKLIDVISKSVVTFIFFGKAHKNWYRVQEELVLYNDMGKYRKAVFVDEPMNLKAYVNKTKYDRILGKIDDLGDDGFWRRGV
jgi:hypothetical protein